MVTRAEFEGENALLTALSASDYLLLRPQLKQVALQQGDVLQAYGERIQHVFFPLSGMISILSVMQDGKAVETSVVGRKGVLGAQCGLGISHAYSRAVVQIAGGAVRIGGAQFTLGGQTYHLIANNGPNTLHGGPNALDRQVWTVSPTR